MDHVAVLVAENLDLDMARVDDELLDEHAIVAEARFRFGARRRVAFLALPGVVGDPHALAAATGRGLDHHGVADFSGELDCVFCVRDLAEISGDGGHLRAGSRLLALDFVAHGCDGAWVWANEYDAGFF